VFSHRNFHIHVPAGAIPKDGPSAGIAIATALTSLLTGRAVDRSVAMTGEITLRGQVLRIGGVREKILAARRAGLRTVIIPRQNEADLEDIPTELLREMQILLVDRMDEVLANALRPGPPIAQPLS
ncbi:MAG: endopeptidase La, partial [Cyanobacteria bacterium REEB65]|nr:endopeptidase La [Cyanobacteria bacterium REEB65]